MGIPRMTFFESIHQRIRIQPFKKKNTKQKPQTITPNKKIPYQSARSWPWRGCLYLSTKHQNPFLLTKKGTTNRLSIS
jgi:hypothetical protein